MKPYVYLLGDSLSYPVLENLDYRNTVNIGLADGSRVENFTIEFGNNSSGTQALNGGRINNV
jgi:hypothetical protein